jgi:hypothetical protein
MLNLCVRQSLMKSPHTHTERERERVCLLWFLMKVVIQIEHTRTGKRVTVCPVYMLICVGLQFFVPIHWHAPCFPSIGFSTSPFIDCLSLATAAEQAGDPHILLVRYTTV